MATWATVMASPALTPSHGRRRGVGGPAGEGARRNGATARQVASRRSSGHGWTIIAAWTSSKAPALEHDHLAAAALLGRRPEHPDGEPELVGHAGQARPAPTAAAAMMLWPQAWPTPGSASYSAQTATTSGPEPASAPKAVGMPQTPAVDREPARGQRLGHRARPRTSSKAAPGGRGWRG